MVRAEIVRIVGAKHDGLPVFRQKPNDARRFAAHDGHFKGAVEWPGVGVPIAWADTEPDWEVDPALNGHAELRCRRLELSPPQIGHKIGMTRLTEGPIRQRGDGPPAQDWSADRRWLDLYEIALAPGRRGGRGERACIILAHPFDVTPAPVESPITVGADE